MAQRVDQYSVYLTIYPAGTLDMHQKPRAEDELSVSTECGYCLDMPDGEVIQPSPCKKCKPSEELQAKFLALMKEALVCCKEKHK